MNRNVCWAVGLACSTLFSCGLEETRDSAADDGSSISTSTSTSELSATQGTSYQGTSYQGTSYQGTSYQGTSYQGTSYQGASLGGVALNDIQLSGTQLVVWKYDKPAARWEQRFPNRICYFNADRTVWQGCKRINLAGDPSPLSGTLWPVSFVTPEGVVKSTRLRVDAVAVDTTQTLFLNPNYQSNSDVFLYTLTFLDTKGTKYKQDDEWLKLCPDANEAVPLSGTWDATGAHTESSANFTFACTTGTIAKCLRWGYKPWKSAPRAYDGSMLSLKGFHLACTRAATADYCGDGRSYTKNGTLIDVYDGEFIGRTKDVEGGGAWTAEGLFQKDGAVQIASKRYSELVSQYPLQSQCPGRFELYTGNDDVLKTLPGDEPVYLVTAGWDDGPAVFIDTTTTCAHSERMEGRWLHPGCNSCQYEVWKTPGYNHCGDPGGRWDATCVARANAICHDTVSGYPNVSAPHSECAEGPALRKNATGCTLKLCSDPAYASCCTTGWTAACVAAANQRCSGGLESLSQTCNPVCRWRFSGFCGGPADTVSGTVSP
jgi:hypothetical protein